MPEATSHQEKPFKDETETKDISRVLAVKWGGFAKIFCVYTREILRLWMLTSCICRMEQGVGVNGVLLFSDRCKLFCLIRKLQRLKVKRWINFCFTGLETKAVIIRHKEEIYYECYGCWESGVDGR
jgi:hypothetical protein